MGELKYKASLTREQFLFYETRIVARLMLQGKSEVSAGGTPLHAGLRS